MRIQAFDFSVNLLKVLLWQYNDAARLQSLLEQKQAWYDENQTQFWENWYTDVFDLRTANDFGLAVWSILLGIPLFVESGGDGPGKEIWGFGEDRKNYNNGNFASFGGGTIGLSTAQKRLVLRLRYFQLITRGAIPEINRFLRTLWPDFGTEVYALDGLNMEMTYVFSSALPSQLQFVLENFDILPRPAAVKLNIVVLLRPAWGFGEFRKNFDNGNFV